MRTGAIDTTMEQWNALSRTEKLNRLSRGAQSFIDDAIEVIGVTEMRQPHPAKLRLLGRYPEGTIDLTRTWKVPKVRSDALIGEKKGETDG